MVDSALPCFLLLLATTLFVSVAAGPPAELPLVDWSECEKKLSCFVPGSCVGAIYPHLERARRPADDCATGLLVEIKKPDEWELTVVTRVPTNTIELKGLGEELKCTATAALLTKTHATTKVKYNAMTKTAKGRKCVFGVEAKDATLKPLRKFMFAGVDATSMYELLLSTPGETNPTGHTSIVQKDIFFRLPDLSTPDWSVCKDQVCYMPGLCGDGRPHQLAYVKESNANCPIGGVIWNMISRSEWQITIFVDESAYKDDKNANPGFTIASKVALSWIGQPIFVCDPSDLNPQIPKLYQSDGRKMNRHFTAFDTTSKRKMKCTFTLLAEIDPATQEIKDTAKELHKYLFDKQPAADATMELAYDVVGADGSAKPKRHYAALLSEVTKSVHLVHGSKCTGCKPCAPDACIFDDTTVKYASGPCEQYTCADQDATMLINKKPNKYESLTCRDEVWQKMIGEGEKPEHATTVTSIQCVKDLDCQLFTHLHSSCGSNTPSDKCTKINITGQSIDKTICAKDFSLVFWSMHDKNKLTPLTSIACNRKEGYWTAKNEKAESLVIKKKGKLACVSKAYMIEYQNRTAEARFEANPDQEKHVVITVALYVLAVIFGIVVVMIIAAFICTKIKTRKEKDDSMPDGAPVIHPTPILTIQKMETKRQIGLAAT